MANIRECQPALSDAVVVDSLDIHVGIGLSDPQLNYEVRKKLDAMNKLHSTGVQIDLDLPQIAVIGSQSAGKSSLIESISGITLPRAAGTCTRCPMECLLSQTSGPWQCVVSLRFTTDSEGKALGQARNEQFGEVIYNKAEVEERIRRAQRAILNPHKALESFLDNLDIPSTEDPLQLAFSVNCVTVQISGPDVADLSFCDLPGLIASVSGGADRSIALVENLVTSYIKKPSCIILLTVACETDFENQGAHRLAKQYDPEGKRTIGVLTKPDRIPLGEESDWLPFIRDEKEPLENNWFCVKQPSSNELKSKITWAEARQAEEDFFESTAPWSTLEDTYKRYLKTGNLVERLSTVLYDLIEKRMPQIQDELDRSILNTRQALSRLPPAPTSDPRSEILTLLHKFSQDLALEIEGVPEIDGSLGLIQAVRPEQEKFKRAIRATAPNFSPFEKSAGSDRALPTPAFLPFEEEVNTMWSPQAQKKIFVDEVLERALRARTRELPGHYPFVVQKTFIQSIIKQWSVPSEELCQTIHTIVSKHAKQLVQKHFEHFGQGRLAHQVRVILQQHINECLAQAEERVKWLLRLEDVPFSLNTHYLADYRDKFLTYYKDAREKFLQDNRTKKVNGGAVGFPALISTTSSQSSGKPFQWTAPMGTFSLPNNPPSQAAEASKSAFTFANKAAAPPKAAAELSPTLGTPPASLFTSFGASSKPAAATSTIPNSSPPLSNTLAPTSTSTSEPPIPQLQKEFAVNKVLSGLAEMGMPGIKAEDLPKLLPPDRMEPALVIMADVRAYFQVAYKRFADNVPLAIDVELVRGVETDILSVLYAKLGINGPNGNTICKDLAQESRKISDRRKDLTKKLERLETARLELFAI